MIEAKEKQGARKKAVHVAKSRPQHVQEHFDDLGDNLFGLDDWLEYSRADLPAERDDGSSDND